MKIRFIIILLTIPPVITSAQVNRSSKDSIAVTQTLNNFVNALSNLQIDKLREQFSEDATAFFPPSSKRMQRANNRKEIESTFSGFFDNLKKQSISHLDIHPVDLRIQWLGNVAIASFHLNDPEQFGRRTVVLQKLKERWRIVHLHASAVKSH